MRWSDIDREPTSQKLRQFAALCLIVFGSLALWQGIARGNVAVAVALAAAALALGPLGLARPQALRWVYVGWMMAAFPVGWVVSQILLFVVFFGILTPLALVFRLVGRDVLLRRPGNPRESFWIARSGSKDAGSYFRQS